MIMISEENAEKCYERLAINNDYDGFWDKVYVCVDKNTYNKYLEEYNVDPVSRTLNKKTLKND